MIITKFAQSCCLIVTGTGLRILVDPGKYSEFGKDIIQEPLIVDIIIVTHEHEDHYFMEWLIKLRDWNKDVIILTNNALSNNIRELDTIVNVLSPNNSISLHGNKIIGTPTDHVNDEIQIPNFGFVLNDGKNSLYFTSDTRYIFPDRLEIAKAVDIMFVPISDRGLVMGIDDAAYFASQLQPKLTVPMHYDSPKDKDRVNPEEFIEKLSHYNLKGKVLERGQTLQIGS